MKINKELDNTSTASWMYVQQRQQEKKQSKQLRSMKQGKKNTWNNMESV